MSMKGLRFQGGAVVEMVGLRVSGEEDGRAGSRGSGEVVGGGGGGGGGGGLGGGCG